MTESEPAAEPESLSDDDCCCCGPDPEPPGPLARALEQMIGVVAAFCLVALMIGGTVALLRWWL